MGQGVWASRPRLLKLRSQGSGPWFVFVHRQTGKARGFCTRQGVEVLPCAPGPHRPVPQALLQVRVWGQTLAFVLGSRLSMQVRACEGAPPGSPSC